MPLDDWFLRVLCEDSEINAGIDRRVLHNRPWRKTLTEYISEKRIDEMVVSWIEFLNDLNFL